MKEIQREEVGGESKEKCISHREAKQRSTTHLKSKDKVHPREFAPHLHAYTFSMQLNTNGPQVTFANRAM